MDGAQFAKMLSDKHLFELNRMEYKYSTVSVKEFAEWTATGVKWFPAILF